MIKKFIIIIILILIPFTAKAEYQIYLNSGGMKVSEAGTSEGHKHFVTIGMDFINYSASAKYVTTHKIEGLIMAEAEDEDVEMIHNGFKIGIETKMSRNSTPFIGIYFNHWERKPNPKYPFGYDKFGFADLEFGFEYNHKNYFARIGGNYPFWSDNLDGRIDLIAAAGYKFNKNIELGLNYRKISFSGDENNPNLRVSFPEVFAIYKF